VQARLRAALEIARAKTRVSCGSIGLWADVCRSMVTAAESRGRRKVGLVDAMNPTFIKAVVALVPACGLLAYSVILFFRGKSVGSLLQLFGAACLVLIVLTHICEALHLFDWMGWGEPRSAGHYLNVCFAVLALTLLAAGFLKRVHTKLIG
jgi:hypothetical protein